MLSFFSLSFSIFHFPPTPLLYSYCFFLTSCCSLLPFLYPLIFYVPFPFYHRLSSSFCHFVFYFLYSYVTLPLYHCFFFLFLPFRFLLTIMSLSLSTIVFLPLFAIFVLACLNCLFLSFCSHSLPRIYVLFFT